jgi:hypothetical protein
MNLSKTGIILVLVLAVFIGTALSMDSLKTDTDIATQIGMMYIKNYTNLPRACPVKVVKIHVFPIGFFDVEVPGTGIKCQLGGFEPCLSTPCEYSSLIDLLF